MAKIQRFEDIEAWKLARRVSSHIYNLSSRDGFSRDFALVNQIRRAAISILSNIAEGFEREGNKEFIQFLGVAKGSCGEVRAQLYVALDQKYVNQREFDEIYSTLLETARTISGLMKYLQHSGMRGSRFKQL